MACRLQLALRHSLRYIQYEDIERLEMLYSSKLKHTTQRQSCFLCFDNPPRFKRGEKKNLAPEQNAVIHTRCVKKHLHTPADKVHGWIFRLPDITWKDSPRQQATDKLVEARQAASTLSQTQSKSHWGVNKHVRLWFLSSHTYLWGRRQV